MTTHVFRLPSIRRVFSLLTVGCLLLPLPLAARSPELPPPGLLSFAGQGGEDPPEYRDSIWYSMETRDYGLLFMDAQGIGEEDTEQGLNIGTGFRQLFKDQNIIAGLNLYYDQWQGSQETSFEQVGGGLEFLSEWFDARVNCYFSLNGNRRFAEFEETEVLSQRSSSSAGDLYAQGHDVLQDVRQTTTASVLQRSYGVFEVPLEGFDFEVGGWLPFLGEKAPETGLFAGYFNFGERFGNGDVDGFKARMEMRLLPAMAIDAQAFSNDELSGTDYFIGGRIEIPFDLAALFQGRFPGLAEAFRPGRRPFAFRMGDRVRRHAQAKVMEKTKPIGERQTTQKIVARAKQVLYSDVQFVNNANETGIEDGTIRHPHDSVQEGVAAATGSKIVYVFAGAGDYPENVTLANGVRVFGQGAAIRGAGGRSFGGDRYPTLDGQGRGPTVRLADNTVLRGVRVVNTGMNQPPQFVTIAGQEYDISRVGVFGNNVTGAVLGPYNRIENNSIGVLLGAETSAAFTSILLQNTVVKNTSDGVRIVGQGASGTMNVLSLLNDYSENEGNGLSVLASGFDAVNVWSLFDKANDNKGNGFFFGGEGGNDAVSVTMAFATANGNGRETMATPGFPGEGSGIRIEWMEGVGDGGFLLRMARVSANGNAAHGIDASVVSTGPIGVTMNGVTASENVEGGVDLFLQSTGLVSSVMRDLTLVANRGAGLYASMTGGAGVDAEFSGVTADKNLGPGIWATFASVHGNVATRFNSVRSSNNGGSGIGAFAAATGRVDMAFTDVTAEGNGSRGIEVGAVSAGDVSARFAGVNASGNGALGLWTYLASLQGSVAGNMERVTASDNGLGGIEVDLSGTTESNLRLTDIRAERNEEGPGIYLHGDPDPSSTVFVFGERIVARNNEGSGLLIDPFADAQNAVLDFGGGTLGSAGLNSLAGNAGPGFSNFSGFDASARFSFWGNVPPIPIVDYSPDVSIDVSDHLTMDLNP